MDVVQVGGLAATASHLPPPPLPPPTVLNVKKLNVGTKVYTALFFEKVMSLTTLTTICFRNLL